MPAVFANRSMCLPCQASPRVAVFLQNADLVALRRLLDWTVGAAETPPEGFGGSMH